MTSKSECCLGRGGAAEPLCSTPDPQTAEQHSWRRSPFALSLASGTLLWAAFPPLGWWPLAWIAPLFWLLLIRQRQLPGRWPYLAIWFAGLLHWAVVMQGVRLAHPALYLGWLTLAAYLGVYPALFVGLTRVAVHRLGISLVVAGPVIWTGLELVRGHAFTGFSMALLGHTQLRWLTLIQIADVLGAYGVSFTVMLVAAAVVRAVAGPGHHSAASSQLVLGRPRVVLWPLLTAAAWLGVVIGYGFWRQHDASATAAAAEGRQPLRVALIQASFDTVFQADPKRDAEVFSRYMQLSREAVREHPDVDLIVWPESAFTGTMGELVAEGPLEVPGDIPLPPEDFRRVVRMREQAFREKTRSAAADLVRTARGAGADSPSLSLAVGTDSQLVSGGKVRRFNAALLIGPDGQVRTRYFKMHLVMFGEYIPFGRRLPLLYRLTPMSAGLDAGEEPRAFQVGSWTLAPSICFESTVAHLIRRQVVDLRRSGSAPEVLVNVTNDGWFWGSAILDLHLACAVFRAVENRLPVLVAANTGLSAYIESNGRIGGQGLRRTEAVVYAEVASRAQGTWYQRLGDLPAGLCLLFCFAVSVVGARDRFQSSKISKSRNKPPSPLR